MSSGVSDLTRSPVNLAAIREHSRKELSQVLDAVPGKKVLVIDPQLTGPLGLIAEVALLKSHAVEKIHHLRDETLTTDISQVIYLCRPQLKLMKIIAKHVTQAPEKQYNLFFVPRRTLVCQRLLEKEGVIDDIKIGDYNLDVIPYDDDVISLGLDPFRELFLDGDESSLFSVARAIMKMQTMFGYIPNVKAKGTRSATVVEMIKRMRDESASAISTPVAPEIENLIIIDRDVDFVTPLLTQLTYEGLIDEYFRIMNTYVELDPELVGQKDDEKAPPAPAAPGKRVKYPLNNNDRLFSEIRDVNFSVIGPILNKKAQYVSASYEERHQAQTVTQLRDFMKKLGDLQAQHQALRVHTNVADRIGIQTSKESFHKRLEIEQSLLRGATLDQDYIEECINKQEPLTRVLRLLCLASLTGGGLKTKQFDFFRREILHTYGYQTLFTLHALEKMGLLKQNDGKSSFSNVRKALRLIVDDVNEEVPNDISYVYSGYAPLLVRLVQQALRPGGWKAIDETMRQLPGPTVEIVQKTSDPYTSTELEPAKKGLTLIFFVGGCTYTEMSAIRLLSQSEEAGQRDFIIATTHIIGGDSMLDSVAQQVENNIRKIEI